MTEAVASPNSVAVKAPDGSIYEVPSHQLAELPEGAAIASQEEVARARAEAEYGGFKGGAAAAGLGLARGLTFGASDLAATSVADALGKRKSVAEALKGYEEANPIASGAGEVVGAIAPALFSGGTSAEASLLARGARAAGTIPRAVYGAGRAAESAVGGLVGREAENLALRTGQTMARHAAGAAVEGAAFGAGQELSDAAINDHDLTAEKLWAAAGKGALLGGALGAGTGAVSELGGAAVRGLASNVVKNESIGSWLEKESAKAAFRSARPGSQIAKAAENFADGGYFGVGRRWRDEVPELVGKDSIGAVTPEDYKIAAPLGKQKYGEKLSEIVGEVDRKVAPESLPKALDIANEAGAIASRLEQRAGAGAAVSKIRSFEKDVRRITGLVDEAGAPVMGGENIRVSFDQLRKLRMDADDIAFGAKINADLMKYKGAFSDLRNRYETILTDGIRTHGDAGLIKEYESAKEGYKAFNWLEKASAKDVGAATGNSLMDRIAGYASGRVAGVVGALAGGPVGYAIGEGLGSLGAGLIRKHGSFIKSDVFQRLGKLAATEVASARIDGRISEGVGSFLRGTRAEASSRSIPRESADSYVRQAQQVTRLAQNPEALQAHIEKSIGVLGPQAPNLTRALAMKASNDISFLASKAPKVIQNFNSLTPQLEKPRFSRDQVAAFAKYMQGVRDPLSLVDDLRRGTVSRETVDAVRATSPKIYDQIRNEVIEQSTSLNNKLSYAKKLQLGILFQAPTDETLTPEFIRAMQQTTQTAPPAPEPTKPQKQGGGRRPIDLNSTDYQSETEDIATGRD